ncbi:conserved unknown protein [Ectocarpus siliculosus]|uniref:YEATS domain-containing protein n=1 Tax=Ectocarpus siliculosus TaxID=2880 RepID=D7FWH7_ECTSI|nr:conserved unknown protein [Ectocarpus siliculosus]|eukprot:CBJ32065.1 conserved unknown protein [Ectocarpus siliculosus]
MASASKPPADVPKIRKKGLSVACPIAYGSLAFLLERKKQSEFVTHKWTLFVRGPNGEDISYFVSKVVFTLHPSFAEATREITSPPFEVTEMGWGEFEAKMTMHFKDPNEKPVDVLHQLRLYHDPATGTTQPKKAVVAEFYDEVVFTDPYEEFYNTLMQGQKLLPQRKHEHQEHFSTFSDGDTLQRLAAAREWVHNQLRETKDRIRKADMDMAQLKASATASSGRGLGRGSTAQTSQTSQVRR